MRSDGNTLKQMMRCMNGLKVCNYFGHGQWTLLSHLHIMNNQTINFCILIPIGLMAFLEFWSGSYRMSLKPIV